MLFISFFGSGGFIGMLTFSIYLLTINRIKSIAFIVYMSLILYINGLLKNMYH